MAWLRSCFIELREQKVLKADLTDILQKYTYEQYTGTVKRGLGAVIFHSVFVLSKTIQKCLPHDKKSGSR